MYLGLKFYYSKPTIELIVHYVDSILTKGFSANKCSDVKLISSEYKFFEKLGDECDT